jgi:hypothetical protein
MKRNISDKNENKRITNVRNQKTITKRTIETQNLKKRKHSTKNKEQQNIRKKSHKKYDIKGKTNNVTR